MSPQRGGLSPGKLHDLAETGSILDAPPESSDSIPDADEKLHRLTAITNREERLAIGEKFGLGREAEGAEIRAFMHGAIAQGLQRLTDERKATRGER